MPTYPKMAYWNGDEFRWHRWNKPASPPQSISVIEPAKPRDEAHDAPKVPFGFSRVLAPKPSAAPDTLICWEEVGA